MGLLADVYSYGDSMKRKVRGLLSDPLGTIEQGIRNFGEDQNQMLQTMQNAYPIPGNKMANFTPAQIDNFRRQLADQATAQGMAGMTVWHGSPHKFDRFDSSKIGTGEGAQAYGHGLYLAESPDVAKGYRDKLSGAGYFSDDGKYFMKNDSKGTFHSFDPKTNSDALISEADFYKNAPASLYKVDLPDEQIAKMLDWDKPLSQQPHVLEAISKHPTIGKNSAGWKGAPSGMYEKSFANPERNGEWLYRDMLTNNPESANTLRDMGIPGIRYLDGGSRSTGQGSSNFVIFPQNEGLLQILERNGAPL